MRADMCIGMRMDMLIDVRADVRTGMGMDVHFFKNGKQKVGIILGVAA